MVEGEERAAVIAKGLTPAQKRAVVHASWADAGGVWHPEGWYCAADRRVRYALCRARVTRDYLRRSNRLTELGLAVREHLTRTSPHPETTPDAQMEAS